MFEVSILPAAVWPQEATPTPSPEPVASSGEATATAVTTQPPQDPWVALKHITDQITLMLLIALICLAALVGPRIYTMEKRAAEEAKEKAEREKRSSDKRTTSERQEKRI